MSPPTLVAASLASALGVFYLLKPSPEEIVPQTHDTESYTLTHVEPEKMSELVKYADLSGIKIWRDNRGIEQIMFKNGWTCELSGEIKAQLSRPGRMN